MAQSSFILNAANSERVKPSGPEPGSKMAKNLPKAKDLDAVGIEPTTFHRQY